MGITNQLQSLLSQTHPILMGVINVTQDSFYDGGFKLQNLANQLRQFDEGKVDIIDIGAESSRPGATPITATEEIDRLGAVLSLIKEQSNALISIDTYKPETAKFALQNGAHIINDISGGENGAMLQIVSEFNAGIVLMHKQGTPKTMQNNPSYENIINDIKHYLSNQIQAARDAGINTIMIDPGIGFGKTLVHNLMILKHLNEFQDLHCPILIGTSNKSFIGELTGANVDERIPGSIASIIAAYQKGAQIFRIHNVKETRQAFDVFEAVK